MLGATIVAAGDAVAEETSSRAASSQGSAGFSAPAEAVVAEAVISAELAETAWLEGSVAPEPGSESGTCEVGAAPCSVASPPNDSVSPVGVVITAYEARQSEVDQRASCHQGFLSHDDQSFQLQLPEFQRHGVAIAGSSDSAGTSRVSGCAVVIESRVAYLTWLTLPTVADLRNPECTTRHLLPLALHP